VRKSEREREREKIKMRIKKIKTKNRVIIINISQCCGGDAAAAAQNIMNRRFIPL
jgi:hypothetical protein